MGVEKFKNGNNLMSDLIGMNMSILVFSYCNNGVRCYSKKVFK